jgi:hypothetical protein
MLRSSDLEVEAFDEGVMGQHTLIGTGKIRVRPFMIPCTRWVDGY